jgi:hypothetical protein
VKKAYYIANDFAIVFLIDRAEISLKATLPKIIFLNKSIKEAGR